MRFVINLFLLIYKAFVFYVMIMDELLHTYLIIITGPDYCFLLEKKSWHSFARGCPLATNHKLTVDDNLPRYGGATISTSTDHHGSSGNPNSWDK